MSNLKLTLSCRPYDRTRALIDGRIKPDGIDITYLPFDIDTFDRMADHLEFDICEIGLQGYILERAKANPTLTGIPVFPHRTFRHSYVFCNKDAGIKEPRDLAGKKVGLPSYRMDAAIWVRGVLQDEYGVRPETIKWFAKPDRPTYFAVRKKLSLSSIPTGTTLDQLLIDGKLDALVEASVTPSSQKGSKKIARLFPNFKEVEMRYYKKTGIFPIMHIVAMKSSLFKEHPWVATSMVKAFVKSKRVSYRLGRDPRLLSILWNNQYLDEQRAIFGPDPYPYNVKDNEKVIETSIRYMYEQGFIKRKMKVSDLFPSSMLELSEGRDKDEVSLSAYPENDLR